MKANEALTLDACLLALLQYGDSVPAEVHEQIQKVRAQVAEGSPVAVNQLKQAIESDDRLRALYRTSRSHLVAHKQPQERPKSAVVAAPMPALHTTLPSNPVALGSSLDRFSNGFSLADIAAAILSSPTANYRAHAQQVLNRPTFQKKLAKASGDLRASVQELEQTASRLHPTKVAMLKKIENNFFTVDDLAYSLEIPLESAQRYAKALWNEGYVRPTSANLLKQLWLSLKGACELEQLPDPEMTLALTHKGHFYLHPGTLGRALSKQKGFV